MLRTLRYLVAALLLGVLGGCSGSKEQSATHPTVSGTTGSTQPASSPGASQKDNTHLPG